MILATAFIGEHIMCTEPDRHVIVSMRGRTVPILGSHMTDNVTHVKPADQDEHIVFACRVAKYRTILPRTEAAVMLRSKSAGTLIVESSKQKTFVATIPVAREIAEVVSKRPFHVMVSNLTN